MKSKFKSTKKPNMDTQNDGLDKVDSFKICFFVSMLDFWGGVNFIFSY